MFTSSRAVRCFVALLLTLFAPAGRIAQAATDTDSDGMDDDWEFTHFGNLSATSAGDADADGMTNGEEYLNGLVPTVNDAFADSDGDRYPNVFEVRSGSDPNDPAVVPTPTYLVNGAGGGTHATISAALSAASVANGAYQIIGIAPGVYTGAANLRSVTVASTKPKLLFIGLQGAAKTVIDGGNTNDGWLLQNSAVISSLTFRNTRAAVLVQSPAKELRLVDLMVRDNTTTSSSNTPGLQVSSMATGGKVSVVGSTFLDNTGAATVKQINIMGGATTLVNTVVWSQTSGTMVAKGTSATLATNNCLVKGQLLTGTGNLAGNVDPIIHPDGHLLWNSPLRGAGGTIAQSRVDIDGELRPSTAPDIGVDQFNDSDSDELADQWELEYAGNQTTLTGRAQDGDGDGLSNEGEHANATNPLVADTDNDSVSDGDEVLVHGSNPLHTDTDSDDMPDGWESPHGLSPVVANAFDDEDGDRYPNVFEYAYSTDPSDRASTPTPTYVVDGAGGGTHTTISAAASAANVANGAYQVIGIAPGVYTGLANLRSITISSTKPKLLFIGLQGATNTIIDGGGSQGWLIQSSAVISSLTFRKSSQALEVRSPANDVRLVDLIVRNNANSSTSSVPSGLYVTGAGVKVYVVGSTFLDNTDGGDGKHITINSGAATLVNTVVWSQTSGTMVAKGTSATLTTNNCLVKGQPLTGTGNLAGNVDPRLRPDGHLLWNSPLRGAGRTIAQSRVDIDGELRPSTAPDIGVDQFNDSDSDELADQWELEYAGDQTTLTGRAQDGDGDGLSNEGEYANATNPLGADTDNDSVSDGDEVLVHGSNPLSTDTDGDDIPDGWEITHGLSPVVANAFVDNDGDRYPNAFEYAYSTDPNDDASTPTPAYVVNGAGGGTHTTISAAVSATNTANGAYQIIGIAPGVYTGLANLRGITISSTKPKLLFIGLQGASKTIIDGGGFQGWLFQNSAVVSSLTFRNTSSALYVEAAAKDVRFVDLIVRNNANSSASSVSSGLYVTGTGVKVYVVGSTFLDNTGGGSGKHITINSGAATLVNTVVWGQTSDTMVAKGASATLTTNNCLVKGQPLTGTGNLAGNVDPKLRSDGRLRTDSPLRGAGGTIAQSRIDIDNELRPSTAPDIGVDQFNDSDGDGLPDAWELATVGNTSSILGSADDDNDLLNNSAEYDHETNWLDPDVDHDGVIDGVEVAAGTNPFVADAEQLGDFNHDGLNDSIGLQLGYVPQQLDSDGDSISNTDELLMGTNPLRGDSDGDGVPDNTDKFPLDPLMSTLPPDPQDVSPPVITLTTPWYAVEQ
jgi:hypothetical protein